MNTVARRLHFHCKFICHCFRPRQISCVSSCKPRLAFILSLNCCGTYDQPRPIRVFINENARCTASPPRFLFFSGEMRLAFTVTVNSYDTRPTAPGVRIFFNLNVRHRNPSRFHLFFQWRCVLRSRWLYIYMWCGRSRLHSFSFPK